MQRVEGEHMLPIAKIQQFIPKTVLFLKILWKYISLFFLYLGK